MATVKGMSSLVLKSFSISWPPNRHLKIFKILFDQLDDIINFQFLDEIMKVTFYRNAIGDGETGIELVLEVTGAYG